MDVYTYTDLEMQAEHNRAKDTLIARLNREHGLAINPAEYLFVIRNRGSLGRIWDLILGKPKDERTSSLLLLRIKDAPVLPPETP